MADKLYNAFNGRFFSEDPDESDGEVMHSVFLSEPALLREETQTESPDSHHEELSLLAKFSEKHGRVNFDRLPTCPLCLERLDNAVTGLHQTPIQLGAYD
mmetsp:Transcript_31338/g.38828  ORF Transcript_31338/g.38828 Transcript_31338/m.38828 type:complete len:100 (+) Transcript_31338:395-694(+)|eukprot:CAMPEP_0170454736 /NCGR_PEP_ID=MMETSP0123-20130129/2888_1 /TAXON_ID=182087 /ORGANISM="Favella ehrenbergii, Strain Fehren 1" /LENGTH=99 /DNA_ID=CAMNT_0010717547 /DNA_START=275 /DNA_END=574 /DNA_ORIENTATION=+